MEIEGWRAKAVELLARDLQGYFPGMAGFSLRNLRYMRKFAETYPNDNVATAVAKIPWGHNITILEKLHNNDQRLWYIQQSIENRWSRSTLLTWIKSDLYNREGKAITNFTKTLPSSHSNIAQQSLKDPYVFDFLNLHEEHIEHDIEQGLIDNVQKMLLEMGKGFALVGRQHHLAIGDKDFYIDLLFYHYTLRCFVVVELKAREFDPRDVGQLNFYLSAVDDLVREPKDKPTIGLLLCKTKNNFIAEYAFEAHLMV